MGHYAAEMNEDYSHQTQQYLIDIRFFAKNDWEPKEGDTVELYEVSKQRKLKGNESFKNSPYFHLVGKKLKVLKVRKTKEGFDVYFDTPWYVKIKKKWFESCFFKKV